MDARLAEIVEPYEGSPRELIPILQRVQDEYGYLPEQEMMEVARFAGVSESKLYGVASFYAQFRFTPVGDTQITVCRGTACHVRGAQQILDEISRKLGIQEGETTPDRKYSLETVACIGCCALAPCITIDERVEARLTSKKVKDVLEEGGEREI
ncbi:MAG: NADH-quinone oxidoreductase subunit NuoE [Candidatus Latescibacteria bacterium]|jgi:NADH-quinone oxidoreductase subunit E|nr:NADH-quinone oxidoreductase subunit NuoE [Candidatus Latescibacterota bacterium]